MDAAFTASDVGVLIEKLYDLKKSNKSPIRENMSFSCRLVTAPNSVIIRVLKQMDITKMRFQFPEQTVDIANLHPNGSSHLALWAFAIKRPDDPLVSNFENRFVIKKPPAKERIVLKVSSYLPSSRPLVG